MRFAAFLSRRRAAAVLLIAAAAGLATISAGAGESLDHGLRNLRDAARLHPASGEIHIVEIDARSIDTFDRWPWPRSIHGAAIDKLREAGVRSIAFDVDFSRPSDARQDAAMAAALKRAGGTVVLPAFRQHASSQDMATVEAQPLSIFADHAFLAGANVSTDPDGYLRRMPFGIDTGGVPRPSLSAMLAEATGAAGTSFAIDYSIDPKSIPRHSLIDLIRGKVDPRVLKGKRVIVGSTAVELGDRYLVPRYGITDGVVVQALGGETLLAGPPAAEWGGAWGLAIALLLLLAATRARTGPKRLGWIGGAAATILFLPLIGETALRSTLAVAPALAGLAAAALGETAALVAERHRQRVRTDSLTGLPNLSGLEADSAGLGAISVHAARLDEFAAVASALGPAATASLVLRLADRLRFATGERTIYRIEDGTLAWLEESEPSDGEMEALAAVMRAPVECGPVVDVAVHFGVAAGRGDAARQAAADASHAALQAARRGLRWLAFSGDQSEAVKRNLGLLAELDRAIAEGQLWNAYQAKLDLRTGEVAGAEALVRWNHPELGALSPDSFIPLIEENKRAGDLTLHIARQALADAHAWEEAGHRLHVAVNISASLLHERGFIASLARVLEASGLPPERVTFEVTETAAMSSPEAGICALETLRSLGVGVSIDDYGTGQSSLSYLQKLPATELKIDMSFVSTLSSEPRNAIMVRSTIAMAHELGLEVVAEGVEDEATLRLLASMKCDIAQGYHIGRPASAAEFLARLAEPQHTDRFSGDSRRFA